MSKNHNDDFAKIHQMILQAKSSVWRQINSALIQLYWSIGEYVYQKVELDGWGKAVVEDLSQYILSELPSIQGFSARNIWRMKQFYETYNAHEKLSTLLTEIAWSNHLHILSKTKALDEKEFYLRLAVS